MSQWLETVDDYLKMTRRDILETKGTVSHKQAIEKAHRHYEEYKRKNQTISAAEQHFLESLEELENKL